MKAKESGRHTSIDVNENGQNKTKHDLWDTFHQQDES